LGRTGVIHGVGDDYVRRRDFIKVITGSAFAWPLAARAQQSAPRVIGFLSSRSEQPDAPFVSAFRQGLVESGDVGKSAKIEFRWADNHSDRLEGLAADLIKLACGASRRGDQIIEPRSPSGPERTQGDVRYESVIGG
jgi:hypothetical protein